MKVVREQGADCLFVGAHRAPGLKSEDMWGDVSVVRVGRPFPLVNGRRPMTYLRGVLSYCVAAFRLIRKKRPALIHASDFEAAVPSVIAGRILGVPVVYNIHDNLSVRYAFPAWARAILNVMEGLVVRASTVTLVPEPFRRDLLAPWARNKVFVVRNSPDDPGYHAPLSTPSAMPRVLFAGWLDFDRGLAQIVALASRGAIRLVVVGDGDERVEALVRGTPNVEFRGFCTHEQVMELTAECDYVAAFYNPTRIINRFAASNKIAEALAIGRPVLINQELMVAPQLIASGVAIAIPYESINELPAAIGRQHPTPESYLQTCEAARKLYERDYHSGQVRQATIEALAVAGIPSWASPLAS
jgi:glycosyltransferase involved in cell wall biosynthesis